MKIGRNFVEYFVYFWGMEFKKPLKNRFCLSSPEDWIQSKYLVRAGLERQTRFCLELRKKRLTPNLKV